MWSADGTNRSAQRNIETETRTQARVCLNKDTATKGTYPLPLAWHAGGSNGAEGLEVAAAYHHGRQVSVVNSGEDPTWRNAKPSLFCKRGCSNRPSVSDIYTT